jgi:hypothetical protein
MNPKENIMPQSLRNKPGKKMAIETATRHDQIGKVKILEKINLSLEQM